MNNKPDIYLGTVLLEINRWNNDDPTLTFKASEWTRRLADDGFDGLELWQRHATDVDEEEREHLRNSPCPVTVFNAYCGCEAEQADERRQIAELAVSLGATGMKYNSGKDFDRHDEYVESLKAWRALLPSDFRLMCECHRGSTMADVELANQTLDRLGRADYGMIIHGINNDEATVRERFAAYGDRMVHIHANLSSDGLISEDALRRRIDLLSELGFNGSYTIEFTEGIRDGLAIEELYANALRDFKMLKKCLDK